LAELVNPKQIVPTTVEIVDIAGLVKGASQGEGLGNQFLGNIRECDAIIHVLRCFQDDNITHVDGSVDPIRDKEVIDTELQFKDLETVEKQISRVEKIAKVGQDKDAKKKYEILQSLKNHLGQGKSARLLDWNEDEFEFVQSLFLLTQKPVLYVCNVEESNAKTGNELSKRVEKELSAEKAEVLVVAVAIEAEIATLETYEERSLFLQDLGLDEPGVAKLILAAYRLLNLQTYFTAGEKEVRAWTIRTGMTAPQAAGVIHTDFERGFIRAEVIAFDDYSHFGSEAAARDHGKLRVEGKEYVVADGDVMHFRFNV
jgi:GTP-binding protein YchF